MHTIHNIPGSQYLEHVDPGSILQVLYSFVFTGSRVGDVTPKKCDMCFSRLFSPLLSLSLSLSTFWVIRFCNGNDRFRYRYPSYFGIIVWNVIGFDIQHQYVSYHMPVSRAIDQPWHVYSACTYFIPGSSKLASGVSWLPCFRYVPQLRSQYVPRLAVDTKPCRTCRWVGGGLL